MVLIIKLGSGQRMSGMTIEILPLASAPKIKYSKDIEVGKGYILLYCPIVVSFLDLYTRTLSHLLFLYTALVH